VACNDIKKRIVCLTGILLMSVNLTAIAISDNTRTDPLNDGPYIRKVNKYFKINWIENGTLREDFLHPGNFKEISRIFNLHFDYDDLKETFSVRANYKQSYGRADSISVISDIHGEYGSYINLLRAGGIIDDENKWNFGTGHLVILGDISGKGEMVTEVFWHLFGLEKQAVIAGGQVHVLLGNHELMLLGNNSDYLNDKYLKVETLLNTRYHDLYSEQTVLGKWLRSRPVVITINNKLFVHGGISFEAAGKKLTVNRINRTFANKIIGKDLQSVYSDEDLKFLCRADGPLWYRGYFEDPDFCENKLQYILNFFDKERIIVGHTPCLEIDFAFNNRIIGVDTGLQFRQPGEMLFISDGSFYRITGTGSRIRIF